VLAFQTFVQDVGYQRTTFGVFEGLATAGSGYRLFFDKVADVVGVPLGIAAAAGAVLSVAMLRHRPAIEQFTIGSAGAVFLVYFAVFGQSDRVEARFVLPVVPLLVIAAAPAWQRFHSRSLPLAGLSLLILVGYGATSSAWVGWRFASDPRMTVQAWVAARARPGLIVESGPYAPTLNKYLDPDVIELRMPWISTRGRMFGELFATDPATLATVKEREKESGIEWYDARALAMRQPDLIVLDSLYFERFLHEDSADYYPEIRTYFTDLFAGRLGYEVALDLSSTGSPGWLYPKGIGFVDNRVVILRRTGASSR
jgi:hypothetical protein